MRGNGLSGAAARTGNFNKEKEREQTFYRK